jgi:tetratricopeptide (TPR) repeat protein
MIMRTVGIERLIIIGLCVGALAAPVEAKRKGGGGDHLEKGAQLAEQKQYDAAIVEFNKAIEENPKDPRAYANRGTAYRASGKFAEALADFSKAIEVAPKDYFGYMERSQTELMQNQFDAALADAEKTIELKPDDPFGYKFRGFANIGLNQWDKAVADFTTAIEKKPDDMQSYDRRAFAYRGLKTPQGFDAAIADYTFMIEKDPTNADPLTKRGYTYSLMTQYEKAIVDYEAAQKIKPEDYETVQRMQYARSQLAMKNAPPPSPTPTPAPPSKIFTPLNIILAIVLLGIAAAVWRLVTRGKPEESSSSMRIR